MAPSAAKLKQALVSATVQVYRSEPDATSVNKVRKHVVDSFDLDQDFFLSPAWKQESKTVIKSAMVCLSAGGQGTNHPVVADTTPPGQTSRRR